MPVGMYLPELCAVDLFSLKGVNTWWLCRSVNVIDAKQKIHDIFSNHHSIVTLENDPDQQQPLHNQTLLESGCHPHLWT